MALSAQTPPRAALFTPKLITVLREGYSLADLRADIVAGLTVAIVALPLSMAIAIASGTTPDRGLVTAIVGGAVISALGGSRHQIGGPAGAFIPLVASTILIHGLDGLVIATFMAGLILLAIGALRLGTYIKYIPHPVTVGFTAGIGLIILSSQIRDLFGLHLSKAEPPEILHKLPVLFEALPTATPAAMLMAGLGIAVILVLRHYKPRWPGFLIVVFGSAVLTTLFHLPVETIGQRFGALPTGLPAPHLPDLSLARITALLPAAIAIALLGGIESLLSAVVADGMTGRRHRSNMELVAQGIGNMASALFGGIAVTGTIARTATNVRAGAHGPVAGILHSVFLLAFLMVAGSYMAYVPLAALAAVLAVVSANMLELRNIRAIIHHSGGDALVLAATLGLTVFVDLTMGISVGIVMGSLLFMHRMAEAMKVDVAIENDVPSAAGGTKAAQDNPDLMVFALSGAFFYGAAANVSATLERIGRLPRAVVLDLSGVPLLDMSGLHVLEDFFIRMGKDRVTLYLAGARPNVAQALSASPAGAALTFVSSVDEARRLFSAASG